MSRLLQQVNAFSGPEIADSPGMGEERIVRGQRYRQYQDDQPKEVVPCRRTSSPIILKSAEWNTIRSFVLIIHQEF